jgi:hypothetical protein
VLGSQRAAGALNVAIAFGTNRCSKRGLALSREALEGLFGQRPLTHFFNHFWERDCSGDGDPALFPSALMWDTFAL